MCFAFNLHNQIYFPYFIMEIQNQRVGRVTENARREQQIQNEEQPELEVPDIGKDSLNELRSS